MDNSVSSVNKSILTNLTLNPEISTCFEEAYSEFLTRKSKQAEANEVIQEIAELLNVSQQNLENIKNQKWFQRAWNTVTGKNKELERVNQTNLLKVQQGSLFFLQNLAETSDELMETVAISLQRIENIQISNDKLKAHILHLIHKYNSKFDKVENKILQHEKALNDLRQIRRKHSYLVLGGILLPISIIAITIAPVYINWILGASFLIPSTICFLLYFVKNPKDKLISEINNMSIININSPSEILKENKKIRPDILKLINSKFEEYTNKHLARQPFSNFGDKNQSLINLLNEIESNNENKQEVVKVVNKIILIEPETLDLIGNNLKRCAQLFCDFQRQLIANIQQKYLFDSVGLDIISSVDHQFQIRLADELFEALKPYSPQVTDINNIRTSLVNQFNQVDQLVNESWITSFGKGFLEGLTFSAFPLASNDSNFLEEYFKLLSKYYDSWATFSMVINNSIINLNLKTYKAAIIESENMLYSLFDEFDNRKISLKPLLNELMNV